MTRIGQISAGKMMDVKIYPAMKGLDGIDIKRHVFVVMDILRASNTIVCLMEKGATHVRVVGEVDEAYKLKEHGYVLIGERLGNTIPGFDLDNSPYKISRQNWNGKKVVLTTTNGTRALVAVQDGFRVAIGSFRNIDAVCQYAKAFDRPIALIPVGDRGTPMLEDELCAEAMLNRLKGESVDWKRIQEAILEKVEMDIGKMGETYRKDALLSTSPNETDIIPVLHDGLVLRREYEKTKGYSP
jgi:phosphosulfolactate phosphohydrolase-like enzyme